MDALDLSTCPPAVAALLSEERLPPLGPGRPDPALRPRLEALAGAEAFAPRRVRDRALADACRAGLWLHFDFLDEAHTISQDLPTAEGSYWHVLAQMPQASCTNGFASITHAILHASFGQYLALLTGWFAPLSETDAADQPADGQRQRDLRGREPDGEARGGEGGLASERRAAEA
jgi:hypothetical protein